MSTALLLRNIPSTITIGLTVGDVAASMEIDGKPAKQSGNPYFSGGINGVVLPGETIEAQLESTGASYDGVELRKGEVHLTQPSVYGKEHAKAGQVIPNTGNQLSISHSGSVLVGGEKFTLVVTFIEKPDGVRLKASAMLQRTSQPTARLSGLEVAKK